jgi:hypothetical protein
MVKAYRFCAVAFILSAIVPPAAAQFPPSADDQQDQAAGAPKGTKQAAPAAAAAAGPNVNGSWTGEITQVGSQTPYKFELVINAKGAETKYPDLDCIGKLTRVGSSKSYAFFVEVITKGQVAKGGRCPDGTITVTREGDGLAVGWFGSVQNNTIIAYGTLHKK